MTRRWALSALAVASVLMVLPACKDPRPLCAAYSAGYSFATGVAFPVLDAVALADPGFAEAYGPARAGLEAANAAIAELCSSAQATGKLEAGALGKALAEGARLVSKITWMYGQHQGLKAPRGGRAPDWRRVVADMAKVEREAGSL